MELPLAKPSTPNRTSHELMNITWALTQLRRIPQPDKSKVTRQRILQIKTQFAKYYLPGGQGILAPEKASCVPREYYNCKIPQGFEYCVNTTCEERAQQLNRNATIQRTQSIKTQLPSQVWLLGNTTIIKQTHISGTKQTQWGGMGVGWGGVG